MKKFLHNLLFPSLFSSILCVYAPILMVVPTAFSIGKFQIVNRVSYHPDLDSLDHHTTFHWYEKATEGFDDNGYDHRFVGGFPMWMGQFRTKITSIVGGYELVVDSRPLESYSPVDIDLGLYTSSGSPISITNLGNWLTCTIDPSNKAWTFEPKPITLWERSIIDPNNTPNDPNNYTISFMADIREAIGKQGGSGSVQLPVLNGTYVSHVSYMYVQVRFNTFPGDFNLDGIVDLKDYAVFAKEWGQEDVNSFSDISGSTGLPDKNLNIYDLALFARDWLKKSNDPNTWKPFVPGQARNPSPPDGAVDVGSNADLSWTSDSDSISYNVHLGTNSQNLSCVSENQTATTFDPGILNLNTRYFWRIDAFNSSGNIPGTLWTFTTIIE